MYPKRVTNAARHVWTGFIRVAPHSGDHRVALRAAVSVAVPLLSLWLLGRLDLSIYASFGAFAALYGRHDRYVARIRMQVTAGLTLITAMLIGTALAVTSAPEALSVLLIALIAAIVTFLAYLWSWHPPGVLFVVFAAGACATLPADPRTFGTVLLVGGASVVFAVTVTITAALVRSKLQGTGGFPRGQVEPGVTIGADHVVAWNMAATVGVGVLLAGAAGLLLVGTHWYWAMVGAVAALSGAYVTSRLVRGAQRLIGTLVGVVAAAGLFVLNMPSLLTIAVAVSLQAAAEMFVGRNYGIAMVFITPLALLMVQLAAPSDPGLLLRDRVLDTVIGVLIGTLVAIVSAALRRRSPRSE